MSEKGKIESNGERFMHRQRPSFNRPGRHKEVNIDCPTKTSEPLRLQQSWYKNDSAQRVMALQPPVSKFFQGMQGGSRRETPNPCLGVDGLSVLSSLLGSIEPFVWRPDSRGTEFQKWLDESHA